VGRFIIHPDVFELVPGMRIATAAVLGVDNQTPRSEVEAAWAQAWSEAGGAAVYGNAQSHPRIAPWRESFTRMGVSGKQFPSSAEALLRRALKGGEPFRINPLVDWYNAISLRHLVPAGGFDLDDLEGAEAVELRLTQAGDTFTALGEDEEVALPTGELAYAAGATVLTRHFVWRQSRAGLITPQTHDVLLMSEVLGEVGADVAETVRADFEAGLREVFGITPKATAVLAASQRELAW
jgi:DNA/RNA-binding domain of Phe-tRNA-synthetase-like protein